MANVERRPAGGGPEQELRRHLLRWDPIGVADEPNAQDEYDDYIEPLLLMLRRGDSAAALASWLTHLVTVDIGLDSGLDRERRLAEELKLWWAEREQA